MVKCRDVCIRWSTSGRLAVGKDSDRRCEVLKVEIEYLSVFAGLLTFNMPSIDGWRERSVGAGRSVKVVTCIFALASNDLPATSKESVPMGEVPWRGAGEIIVAAKSPPQGDFSSRATALECSKAARSFHDGVSGLGGSADFETGQCAYSASSLGYLKAVWSEVDRLPALMYRDEGIHEDDLKQGICRSKIYRAAEESIRCDTQACACRDCRRKMG